MQLIKKTLWWSEFEVRCTPRSYLMSSYSHTTQAFCIKNCTEKCLGYFSENVERWHTSSKEILPLISSHIIQRPLNYTNSRFSEILWNTGCNKDKLHTVFSSRYLGYHDRLPETKLKTHFTISSIIKMQYHHVKLMFDSFVTNAFCGPITIWH